MSDYKDHYEKYIPVYKKLAFANDGKTIWIPTDSHSGWYVNKKIKEKTGNEEAWENGYPYSSRPRVLPDDLNADVERTTYTTISYAEDSSYEKKYYRKKHDTNNQDTIEWMNNDSDRLPDYGDLVAWSIFVDIDIGNEYKERPLNKEIKDVIRQRLQLWVKIFASMSGDMNHVKVLDSGGGFYVFIPPTGLSPVADKYEKEELQLIFEHIGERVRKIVGKVDQHICDQDDYDREIFSADKVQNKNRQYKTIGSIHKSINAVVYPVQPDDIQIQHKKISDITDRDINRAMKWADDFTDNKHRSAVDSIITYLFQGQFTQRKDVDLTYIEGGDWKEILDNWVEERKEQLQKWISRTEEIAEVSDEEIDVPITDDISVAQKALLDVNNKYLKKHIVEFLSSDKIYEKSGEEMDFYPFWRTTESGRSAFYDFYQGKARFTDKSNNVSRGIVYWIALEMTYDDENYPDVSMLERPENDLSSREYRRCIEELQNRGYNIPIYINTDNKRVPKWKIIEVGEKLDIVDDDKIVRDEDGRYKDVKSVESWNKILEKLNEFDIDHGHQKKKPVKKISPPYDRKDNFTINAIEAVLEFSEFKSKDQYENIIESLPDHVILFNYDGKIKDNDVSNDVLAGVFVDDKAEKITIQRLETNPTNKNIRTISDVKIEIEEVLDKNKMRVFNT